MTTAGLENAPVTRSLLILTVLLTVIIGSNGNINLDLNSILHGQVWRLFTSHYTFTNMAQAFVGWITLYNSRHFERQLGVKKYAAFVVISYILSLFLQIALVVIINSLGIENFTPAQGPYFLIFATLSLYYAHTPKLHSRSIALGLEFSEKSWMYLLACQLLLSNGSGSIGSSLIGLLIGYMYDRNIFGIQRFRLPAMLENSMGLATSFLSSMFGQTNQQAQAVQRARFPQEPIGGNPIANPNTFSHDQVYGGWGNVGNDLNREMMQYGGFAPNPSFTASSPPTEESIQTLVGLGFDRNTVLQALEATGNNLEAAANRLLR